MLLILARSYLVSAFPFLPSLLVLLRLSAIRVLRCPRERAKLFHFFPLYTHKGELVHEKPGRTERHRQRKMRRFELELGIPRAIAFLCSFHLIAVEDNKIFAICVRTSPLQRCCLMSHRRVRGVSLFFFSIFRLRL